MLRSFTLAHCIPSNVPDSAGPTSHLLTVLVISSPRSASTVPTGSVVVGLDAWRGVVRIPVVLRSPAFRGREMDQSICV